MSLDINNLKKLYAAARQKTVTLGEKKFTIEKPTDSQWPDLLKLMSNADQDMTNVTLIIKDRLVGWEGIVGKDLVEDLSEEEGANEPIDFSKETLEMFLSENPAYIIGLSHEISNAIVSQKLEEDKRKKKSRK